MKMEEILQVLFPTQPIRADAAMRGKYCGIPTLHLKETERGGSKSKSRNCYSAHSKHVWQQAFPTWFIDLWSKWRSLTHKKRRGLQKENVDAWRKMVSSASLLSDFFVGLTTIIPFTPRDNINNNRWRKNQKTDFTRAKLKGVHIYTYYISLSATTAVYEQMSDGGRWGDPIIAGDFKCIDF